MIEKRRRAQCTLYTIFISDFACLQAINLTNSTTGDLVFMGGTKFCPVYAESSWWNTLIGMMANKQNGKDLLKCTITYYSQKFKNFLTIFQVSIYFTISQKHFQKIEVTYMILKFLLISLKLLTRTCLLNLSPSFNILKDE